MKFTNTSSDPDGSIASRSWNFGDGKTSSSNNPSHTYSKAGTYSVKLTVKDNKGASATKTRSVKVSGGSTPPPSSNKPPKSDFTFKATKKARKMKFTDKSSDSDGSISSRKWDFGNGKTSTSTNPKHTYSKTGTYSVKLTVTDNDGATTSKTKSVTVK